jgi:hypothetical protein
MCFAAQPLFQAPPITASRPIGFSRPLARFAPTYTPAYSTFASETLKFAEREKKAFLEDYHRVMERSLARLEIIPIGPPDYKKILRDMTKPLGT